MKEKHTDIFDTIPPILMLFLLIFLFVYPIYSIPRTPVYSYHLTEITQMAHQCEFCRTEIGGYLSDDKITNAEYSRIISRHEQHKIWKLKEEILQ